MRLRRVKRLAVKFTTKVLTDPDRKSLCRMAREYLGARVRHGCSFAQYFSNFCHRRDGPDPGVFVVNYPMELRCWRLNAKPLLAVLDDKLLFERVFVQAGLPVVRSLAFSSGGVFFEGERMIKIGSAEELGIWLRTLIQGPGEGRGVFLKPRSGSFGGAGIYRLVAEDCDVAAPRFAALYRGLNRSEFILQAGIVQHARLLELNPHCVNTLRIITYSDGREPKVLSTFLRIGLDQSPVDNISSGGGFVGVWRSRGVLKARGFTEFEQGSGRVFLKHPVSGIGFEGYAIPYYAEAERLVLEASRCVPRLRLVGWDVAIRPDGPVLLEGNGRPALDSAELTEGGFREHAGFRELWEAAGRG